MYIITYTQRDENDSFRAFNSVWFDGSLDVHETRKHAQDEADERMAKQPTIIAANIIAVGDL